MKLKVFLFAILMGAVVGVAQETTTLKGLDMAALMQGDFAKYSGIKFIYHNGIPYDGNMYKPPFPFSDGRERSGKYKASQTAMDNYLKSLSKYEGKIFSFVTTINGEMNIPNVVMACENGDTLLFSSATIGNDFISKNYIDQQKKRIGEKFYFGPPSYLGQQSSPSNPTNIFNNYFGEYKNEKTGKTVFYLPYFSEWKIVAVTYDTTYVGQRNMMNNNMNFNSMYDRVLFSIENPNYGKYKAYLNNGQSVIKSLKDIEYLDASLPTKPEDVAMVNEWAAKKYVEAEFIKELLGADKKGEMVSPKMEELAKKLFLPALSFCISKHKTYQDDNEWKITKKQLEEQTELVKQAKKKYGKIPLIGRMFSSIAYVYVVVGRNRSANLKERIDNYKKEVELYSLAMECGIEDAQTNYESSQKILDREEAVWSKAQKDIEERDAQIKACQEQVAEMKSKQDEAKKQLMKEQLERYKERFKNEKTNQLKQSLTQMELLLKDVESQAKQRPEMSEKADMLRMFVKAIKDELKTRKD